MIIISVEFIDQLIDYPINCASLRKCTFEHVRRAKPQISLRIRLVWSVFTNCMKKRVHTWLTERKRLISLSRCAAGLIFCFYPKVRFLAFSFISDYCYGNWYTSMAPRESKFFSCTADPVSEGALCNVNLSGSHRSFLLARNGEKSTKCIQHLSPLFLLYII